MNHFIANKEWPAKVPDFITQWKDFLHSIDEDDYYVGLMGCEGHWGFRCELVDNVLHCAGSAKNKNNELQAFLCKVLVQLGEVLQCKITSDYVLDYVIDTQPTFKFPGDSDNEENESLIRTYTDAELRRAFWKTLSLLF